MNIPMQIDWSEPFRLRRLAELNAKAADRAELDRRHGQTWNAMELATEFEVMGYMAPLVVVKRKLDGKVGSLEFQHDPRFYFNWKGDR